MIPEPLLPNYRTRINIRPIKAALVIRAGSARQLREAVLDSCTVWGGITNPIVQVEANIDFAPLDEYLLRLHEPDVIISYLRADTPTGRARHERLRMRIGTLLGSDVPLHAAQFGGSELGCHPLNAVPSEVLTRQQFSKVRLVALNKHEELALLACFGGIYPGQESDYVRMTRFSENPIGFDDLRFWGLQTTDDPFASPINLTSFGYGAHEVVGSFGSELFELVLGDDIDSLCFFWNLRATRVASRVLADRVRRVVLGPVRLIDDPEALGRLADTVRAAGPSEGVESEVELLVHGPDAHLRRFANAARRSGRLRRHQGRFGISRSFGDSVERVLKDGPVTWASSALGLPDSFRYGLSFEGHEMVPFRLGSNDVRVAPPGRNAPPNGQVMLDFESDIWARIPKSPASAHAVHSNGHWTRHGLSIFARVSATPSFVSLTIPDENEALRHYFSDYGLQVRATKVSGYVDAVVRLIGGPARLPVLATHCAYNIIGALGSKSPKKIAQWLRRDLGLRGSSEEKIAERLGEAGAFLDLSVSKTADQLKTLKSLRLYKQDILATLEILTASSIIRRGIEVECSACGAPTWHPIGSLDEMVACAGCGDVHPLPVQHRSGSGREVPWSYTLNTLVNRAWDQDLGPALLALAYVGKAGKEVACRAGAIEVAQESRSLGDLDFILYRDGLIHAGETKAGPGLDAKDVRFARMMLASGVDVFYFASVEGYSEDAREAIARVSADFEGPPPVTILGPEHLLPS